MVKFKFGIKINCNILKRESVSAGCVLVLLDISPFMWLLLLIYVVVVVVAFPIFFSGLRVGPSFVFPHCTHLLQSAQLRLRRTVCQCVLSACFRTPRLSLGHPGSLTSVHDLKCMRTQTAPLFNVHC